MNNGRVEESDIKYLLGVIAERERDLQMLKSGNMDTFMNEVADTLLREAGELREELTTTLVKMKKGEI